jgi:hypothetical protein
MLKLSTKCWISAFNKVIPISSHVLHYQCYNLYTWVERVKKQQQQWCNLLLDDDDFYFVYLSFPHACSQFNKFPNLWVCMEQRAISMWGFWPACEAWFSLCLCLSVSSRLEESSPKNTSKFYKFYIHNIHH